MNEGRLTLGLLGQAPPRGRRAPRRPAAPSEVHRGWARAWSWAVLPLSRSRYQGPSPSQKLAKPTGTDTSSEHGHGVVGIDLGTTHTVVAWADLEAGSDPAVFPIPQLVAPAEIEARPLFPSCLYAPVPGEAVADPWSEAPWVGGELARRRGAEVPGRLVASSKSWLCHPGVDRAAPILPWGAPEEDAVDLPRISPVDASARYLAHVRRTWDEAFPAAPLSEQEVVLTVPASFDEVARELTLEAAHRAGLAVRLLEEPQAAFYDFMDRAGVAGMRALLDESGGEALVLVCDVGGGTTDLSLIRVTEAARAIRRSRSSGWPWATTCCSAATTWISRSRTSARAASAARPKLDAARFGQLVTACRAAKERLLSADPPESARVTVLGQGARLLGGGTVSTEISREEAERVVLDGFFPPATRGAKPERARSALVAFGLPYERDPAVTRHVAGFFARHASFARGPSAVLLNGGVFLAERIAARLVEAIGAWGGPPIAAAPARGSRSRRRSWRRRLRPRAARARGPHRRWRSARVLRRARGPRRREARRGGLRASRAARRRACRRSPPGRTLALVVGRPVRFDLFASDAATDRPGDVVTLDEDRFEALPPALVTFGGAAKSAQEVRVALEGELTAIGTLDLACVEVGRAPRARRGASAWRSSSAKEREPPAPAPARPGAAAPRPLGDRRRPAPRRRPRGHRARLRQGPPRRRRARGQGSAPRAGAPGRRARLVDDGSLPRALRRARARRARVEERAASLGRSRARLLAPRGLLRPPRLRRSAGRRAASAELIAPLFVEERALPPGAARAQLAAVLDRVAARRRRPRRGRAGGTIRDDHRSAPRAGRGTTPPRKPKGWKAEAPDDLLDLAASLERVPAARRSALGGWILERTWTSRDPRLWAALGRLGARAPAYASVHYVVSPARRRALDRSAAPRRSGTSLPTAARPPPVQLPPRVTDDRGARRLRSRARREVARACLVAVGAHGRSRCAPCAEARPGGRGRAGGVLRRGAPGGPPAGGLRAAMISTTLVIVGHAMPEGAS